MDLPILIVGGADGLVADYLSCIAKVKIRLDSIYIVFFMIVLNYFLALSDDGT
jgi:hypothetical protein